MYGGIARRYRQVYTYDQKPSSFKPPTLQSLLGMNEKNRNLLIKNLSPAEKYDLFKLNFSYPTFKYELNRNNLNAPYWQGLCHGTAPAISYFPIEPSPITTTINLSENIKQEITFYTSDIKALLAFYAGEMSSSYTIEYFNKLKGALKPHQFLQILDYYFHRIKPDLRYPVLLTDLSLGHQVWNYPIIGYKHSIYRRIKLLKGNKVIGHKYSVQTSLKYVKESNPSSYKQGKKVMTVLFNYEIKTDENYIMNDGSWLTSNHPEMLWWQSPIVFNDYYHDISELYNLSIKNN